MRDSGDITRSRAQLIEQPFSNNVKTQGRMNPSIIVGIAPPGWDIAPARVLLEPAAAYGDATEWAEVERDLGSDHAQLWVVHRDGALIAAAVTRLCADGAAEFWLCGGSDMRDWLDALVSTVSAWALAEGKTRLRLYGRPGWRRALPGWTERCVIMERKIG